MNSLLQKEGMAGRVQMIFIDPPYGITYGSNFQAFTNKRDVRDRKDGDLTQEPEMLKAFRDTWELGVHSYLGYLRDRLLLSRELLSDTGSVFVQSSDENVHRVRLILDDIFGAENFCSQIVFRKKTMPLGSEHFESVCDHIVWYAKDRRRTKTRTLFKPMDVQGDSIWSWVELPDQSRRRMTKAEVDNHDLLPERSKVYRLVSLLPAQYRPNQDFVFAYEGTKFRNSTRPAVRVGRPGPKACWHLARPRAFSFRGAGFSR